jgi:thiol-disulfide isomerase/thioredoxin
MTHSPSHFLIGRRTLLAAGLTSFAVPALADIGPALLTGSLAKMQLVQPPKPLPADLSFVDADGKPVELSAYKGKVVLLNFWATWCAPCVKEMPSLDKLQGEIGKDKFIVLPLSLDGPSKPKVKPFYADKKLENLGIYFDQGKKAMQALDVSVLPTSVLIDSQGRAIARLEGDAEWDKPESLALMKAAVG